ncbi:hypothetical protein OROMI_028767 [Orobanche minor]
MNSSTNKGTTNDTCDGGGGGGEQNRSEKMVETVDYRLSGGGQGQQQMQPVQIMHQPVEPNINDNILANAAASVTSTLQSVKDAVSGK